MCFLKVNTFLNFIDDDLVGFFVLTITLRVSLHGCAQGNPPFSQNPQNLLEVNLNPLSVKTNCTEDLTCRWSTSRRSSALLCKWLEWKLLPTTIFWSSQSSLVGNVCLSSTRRQLRPFPSAWMGMVLPSYLTVRLQSEWIRPLTFITFRSINLAISYYHWPEVTEYLNHRVRARPPEWLPPRLREYQPWSTLFSLRECMSIGFYWMSSEVSLPWRRSGTSRFESKIFPFIARQCTISEVS